MATIKSELDYIQEARSQLAEALITKFGVRRYDNAKDNPTLKGLWTVKEDGSADKLKRLHDWALLVTGTNVHTDASLTFKNDGKGDAAGTTFNGSVARSISYNSIGAAASNHVHKNLIIKWGAGDTEGTNLFTYNGGTAKTINLSTPFSLLFTNFSNAGSLTTRITIGGVTKDLKIDADTLDGYHYNQLPYIQRLNWWNEGDSHNANNLLSGTTFAYSTHSNCPTTGTIVAFNCINSTGYPLQLQGKYSGEELWFRNRNGDNGTWQTWRYVIHNGNIGSQSVNYANSAGNADTVDGYHASSLVKFYLSPMASNAPADSAKSWFINTMPSASGAIVYNVPGSEKTIIAGKSSGSYGHMLQLNYDDNYLRLLRYRGGSWMTTDWEKISAGYADSAGNADTVDGLHVHSGRNNEANKIVRTDASGYILTGWINTTSGDMGTTAATRIYCSNDAYIRYKTLANFSSDIAGQLYWANVKVSTSSNAVTTPQFGNVTICDGTNSFLYLKTATAGAYAYLAGYNTGGQYGADVVLHSGSSMVLGAGESAAAMYLNNIDSLQGSENLYLTADNSVKIFANCDSIGNRKHIATFDSNGYAYFHTYINIGGHEKNANSPTYVWGSNSSDNFLRSYQTSSLSVGHATTSNWLNTNSSLTYGASGLNYFNIYGASGNTKANNTPRAEWYHIIRMNHGNSAGYLADIAVPLNDVQGIWWRQIRNGNFYGWYRILDSNNYTEFTVTKTGGGASGTWPISITGNANTATIADQAYNLYYYSADTDEGCKNSKGPGLSFWYTKSLGTSRPTGRDSFMFVMGGTDLKWNSLLCFDMDSTDAIYYRSSDGTPNWRTWAKILTSVSTYVASDGTNRGIINGTEVASARHLLINGVTWNSNWHWSGQSGQPSWLWGSNDGVNMYVWNPSNFSVNYANSAGNADKLDGYDSTDFKTRLCNELYKNAPAWYRLLKIGDYGLSFLITFYGWYSWQPPSPVTFLISYSYGADGIKITQIGRSAYVGWIKKIRIVYVEPTELYLDVYFNNTSYASNQSSGNYLHYEVTPLDETSRNTLRIQDIIQLSDAESSEGSACCYTSTEINADTVGGYHFSDLENRYVNITGDTMTGMLKVNAPIFGYVYGTSSNRAAFIWDKPGSYYTGVGANGSTSTILFSACDGSGNWVDYTQYWVFKGDVTASNFYSSSDIRLKNNINNISKSIRSFTWNDTGLKSYGLIAQEIEDEYPELVSNNDNGYKSINYTSALCMIIARLENTVDTLKERIELLELNSLNSN